jgi:uncharacterized protein (DUF58 family)
VRLYDRPDPRRLDVRASVRDVRGDWLVRAYRQRAAVSVHALVDVSASMAFGSLKPKLHVVADFIEVLGRSAFRVGDALGMLAFDSQERTDLFMPALLSRGAGEAIAALLRSCTCTRSGVEGLESAAAHVAGKQGLLFLISDFHWPLEPLDTVLAVLAHAYVVPVIVWDPAEVEPPRQNGLALLRDMETQARRTLWMRPKLRTQWREAVAQRRAELNGWFAGRGIRPFYIEGEFDPESMSRYFLEAAA